MCTFTVTIIALCLVHLGPGKIDQNAWTRASGKPSVVSGDPTMYVFDAKTGQARIPTAAEAADYEMERLRQGANRREMLDLAYEGKYPQAIKKLEVILQEGSSAHEFGRLGMLYLLVGNFGLAADAVGNLSSTSDDERLLLVAAVLNAEGGRVAPGQNDYCMRRIMDYHGDKENQQTIKHMRNSIAIAYYALGTDCAMYADNNAKAVFYGKAYAHDRTNLAIAYDYAHALYYLDRKKEAAVVAERALPRAKGEMKAMFEWFSRPSAAPKGR